MKIQIEKAALGDALTWAVRAVPGKATIPILTGVLLEAADEALTLAGFDYELSARTSAPAAVSEPGRVVVPGRLLAEVVRSLPPAPVHLAQEGHRLLIRCGTARFELPTLAAEDYPELPAVPECSGRVAAGSFAAAVAQVSAAAGRDETLALLTAVLLEVDGETLTLAATDRYRLAVRELTWRPDPGVANVPPTTLIPARTLSETVRALGAAGADAELELRLGEVGSGLVAITAGPRVATTRLISGSFPNYRSLLPSEFSARVEVAIGEFSDAVRRTALVLTRTGAVTVEVAGDELTISGEGLDAQAQEVIPASLSGDPVSVRFNPAYLLDGLSALDGDTAQLAITSAIKPAVLTGKGSDFRYLLMPVRTLTDTPE